ncbi:MAG: hypothetical protein OXC07_09215 [Kistimonas sp.]|nr:hypothetical protein [Kistimonas sp.]
MQPNSPSPAPSRSEEQHSLREATEHPQSRGISGSITAFLRAVGRVLAAPIYLVQQAVAYPFARFVPASIRERNIEGLSAAGNARAGQPEARTRPSFTLTADDWADLRRFLANAGSNEKAAFGSGDEERTGVNLDEATRKACFKAYNDGAWRKDTATMNRHMADAEVQLKCKKEHVELNPHERRVLSEISDHLDKFDAQGIRLEAARRLNPCSQIDEMVRSWIKPQVISDAPAWNNIEFLRIGISKEDERAWQAAQAKFASDPARVLGAINHFASKTRQQPGVSLRKLAEAIDQARYSMVATGEVKNHPGLKEDMLEAARLLRISSSRRDGSSS